MCTYVLDSISYSSRGSSLLQLESGLSRSRRTATGRDLERGNNVTSGMTRAGDYSFTLFVMPNNLVLSELQSMNIK